MVLTDALNLKEHRNIKNQKAGFFEAVAVSRLKQHLPKSLTVQRGYGSYEIYRNGEIIASVAIWNNSELWLWLWGKNNISVSREILKVLGIRKAEFRLGTTGLVFITKVKIPIVYPGNNVKGVFSNEN